ncbi:MAG: O-antigen ligase family protein, partial [Anaerolineales bacterium]|nr:O-antigen ligase family protein [Anaerolineales bacterium]
FSRTLTLLAKTRLPRVGFQARPDVYLLEDVAFRYEYLPLSNKCRLTASILVVHRQRPFGFLNSRRWATAELGIVAAAALLSIIYPDRALWFVGFGLIPFLLRLPGQVTAPRLRALDFLVAVFLVTGALGIWAAYDRGQAVLKATRLLLAILLLYVVLRQPDGNQNFILFALGLLGVSLIFGYVLWNDPTAQMADFEGISRAREWVGALNIRSDLFYLDPNVLAGVLIFLLPVLVSAGISRKRQTQSFAGVIYFILIVLLLLGLVLTSSRAAWISLLLAPLVGMGAYIILRSWRHGPRARRLLVSGVIGLTLLLLVVGSPAGTFIARNLRLLPGEPTLGERERLVKDSLDLISDFAFTGGGLSSFSGLYSRYIRVIPFHYFRHSHNLYLDLALEQGIFGLIAALGLFLYTLKVCLQSFADRRAQLGAIDYLAWGSFIGFIAVLLHGFGDDPLYGISGTPLFLLPPALALYFSGINNNVQGVPQSGTRGPGDLSQVMSAASRKRSILVFLIILAVVASSWRLLAAGLAANVASVRLAQAELAGWNGDGWTEIHDQHVEDEILGGLKAVLRLDPTQVTSLYRIGHISLSRMDFEQALIYLNDAHNLNP